MSRSLRTRRIETSEKWPNLQSFMAACFPEGWEAETSSAAAAIDRAIAGEPLQRLEAIAREWWDWNRTCSWKEGGLDLPARFGVETTSDDSQEARQFMNRVYDQLIVAIRREAGKEWKP